MKNQTGYRIFEVQTRAESLTAGKIKMSPEVGSMINDFQKYHYEDNWLERGLDKIAKHFGG